MHDLPLQITDRDTILFIRYVMSGKGKPCIINRHFDHRKISKIRLCLQNMEEGLREFIIKTNADEYLNHGSISFSIIRYPMDGREAYEFNLKEYEVVVDNPDRPLMILKHKGDQHR
jgi:hypothetical protein